MGSRLAGTVQPGADAKVMARAETLRRAYLLSYVGSGGCDGSHAGIPRNWLAGNLPFKPLHRLSAGTTRNGSAAEKSEFEDAR